MADAGFPIRAHDAFDRIEEQLCVCPSGNRSVTSRALRYEVGKSPVR